jgi:hypothetical protein
MVYWRERMGVVFPREGHFDSRRGKILYNVCAGGRTVCIQALLSYAALFWAMLHPCELRGILLNYAVPFWAHFCTLRARLYPTEPSCALLSYAAWATLHRPKLCCTLLSYAAHFWASRHSIELHSKKFWNAKINICMLHGGHLQICFLALPICTEGLVIWKIKYCWRNRKFLFWKSLFVSSRNHSEGHTAGKAYSAH